jgi:hypothetical protein
MGRIPIGPIVFGELHDGGLIMKNSTALVSIGLRAKTGRAIAVVLGGSPESPVVLFKTEIKLVDPKYPATAQPYHGVMELPGPEWSGAVSKAARAIELVATRSLAKMIEELRANGNKVAKVGVVGAPERDLARIGNPHIRAHAAEGILFRRVLELGAKANGLKSQTFSDRDFDKVATAQLSGNHSKIKQRLDNLRQSVSPPWRADEKAAAMAAWIVLYG